MKSPGSSPGEMILALGVGVGQILKKLKITLIEYFYFSALPEDEEREAAAS